VQILLGAVLRIRSSQPSGTGVSTDRNRGPRTWMMTGKTLSTRPYQLALSGVEVFSNGSGSHHQLRKLNTRMDLIQSATAKAGGRA